MIKNGNLYSKSAQQNRQKNLEKFNIMKTLMMNNLLQTEMILKLTHKMKTWMKALKESPVMRM